MTTPIKPWEKQLNSSCTNNIAMANISGPSMPQIRVTSNGVPPIPPRPTGILNRSYASINNMPHSNYRTTYGAYGDYGGYGGLSYGGYGMGYGGLSGYGGYGAYGYNSSSNLENRFIQIAEESSRPTFETIESVVRAFGSIAAMLDSTFFAVTSSFRAILGVADSFGRLRTLFQQMWTSLAIFRALNWLLRKLFSLIGLRKISATNEAWKDAISETVTNSPEIVDEHKRHSWPVAVFLAVVVAAPYIISKLFGNIEETIQKDIPTTPAMAFFEFSASTKDELSLTRGQTVFILPRAIQQKYNLINTGWILVKNQQGQMGRIPQNYIGQPKIMKQDLNQKSENSVPSSSVPSNLNSAIHSNYPLKTEQTTSSQNNFSSSTVNDNSESSKERRFV